MNGNTKKRLKRDALDSIMKSYPALNNFLTSLTDEDKPKFEEAVEASIKDSLNRARMDGINIGYIGALHWFIEYGKKYGKEEVYSEAEKKLTEIWKRTMGDVPMVINNNLDEE